CVAAPNGVSSFLSFFFNLPHPPHSSPLSLHDALPILTYADICTRRDRAMSIVQPFPAGGYRFISHQFQYSGGVAAEPARILELRSEEHTSELQSLTNLVCRLLLEKKKNHKYNCNCVST